MLPRSRITTVVAFVLLLATAWTGYRWWFAPERVITRRLHRLAGILSVPARESDLDRLATVTRLTPFFAADVRIGVGDAIPIVMAREALSGAAAAWRRMGRSTVRVEHAEVTVGSETSARARVAVEVIRRDDTVDTRDVQVVELGMTSARGEWVIAAAAFPAAADAIPPRISP